MSVRSFNFKDVQQIPRYDLQYNKEELLGKGSFSKVYRGVLEGRVVAIKKLILNTLTPDLIKDVQREVGIMERCNHCAQIVNLIGVTIAEGFNALILEHMEKGSLDKLLYDKEQELSWPLRYKIALDVAKGLKFLHEREICHRDLKSPNILLDDQYNAKITDFGLAKIKVATATSTKQQHIGTVRWSDPEQLKNPSAQFAQYSDVYSLAMVLWEIASRAIPFNEQPNEMMVIGLLMQGHRVTIPEDCPKEYGELITRIWDKRPGAAYVVEELEKFQPQPEVKCWQYDPETKYLASQLQKDGYVLVPVTDKDKAKVEEMFNQAPVEGYEIGEIFVVVNPTLQERFISNMKTLLGRKDNDTFASDWQKNEKDKALPWREIVHADF
jgi:serine/threonine protein kinase